MRFKSSILAHLCLGFVIRICFLIYGIWQDNTMVVKFTDVDYFVFTDAAKFVALGMSPYERATYRYTPLLAFLMLPNVNILIWGKILFITCDVICGYLIYRILCRRFSDSYVALLCTMTWLYNPLPITVSSRGNAESVISLLILWTLDCMYLKKTKLAAILYALSVHMKIYPVTYALPIYLILQKGVYTSINSEKQSSKWTCSVKRLLLPNFDRMLFIVISGITVTLLTMVFYLWYGDEFIRETYLYHITRRDTRHNFSVYFYMLYLTAESAYSMALGIAIFLPQIALMVTLSFKFYDDLPMCWFLNTFVFVSFNKVCTSQYFLWYLCLLPVVLPSLVLTERKVIVMVVSWFVGQGLWLCPAYYLEFHGLNTFLYIWLAGLIFFLVNVWILYGIIRNYLYTPMFNNGKPVISSPNASMKYLAKIIFQCKST